MDDDARSQVLKDLHDLDIAVGDIEVESRDYAIDMASRLKALRDRIADMGDGLKVEDQQQG